MKTTILFLFVLTTFFAVKCKKKEEAPCLNVVVSKITLQPESVQLIKQYERKKLIFKDSSGNEAVFNAFSQYINWETRTLVKERCSEYNSSTGAHSFGDIIQGESRALGILNNSVNSTNLSSIYYEVLTLSEGALPYTTHYDIGTFHLMIKSEPLVFINCQMSKRGVTSSKDLVLGNRFIGDTSFLGIRFTSVFKSLYPSDRASNSDYSVSKAISSITVDPKAPIKHDIYFTTQQGIIAFKLKGDKLWVLDRIE